VQWYEQNANRRRLEDIELVIMRKRFPQFRLFRGEGKLPFAPPGALYWAGVLTTNFGTSYQAAITYPPNFPYGQIKSYIPELLRSKTPHKYHDGHLCLYSNDHGGPGQGIGKETTAAAIVGWTAAWLNAWEVYKRSGAWPGR
jgi:hypothetical protein